MSAPILDTYDQRLLAFAVAYEANVPVLIWGLPGEGKSAAISAFAADRDLHAEVVVASLRDPTDINGLPVVSDDGSVRFAPPAWLTAVNEHPGAVLVFDELNLAAPATRGATLRVVNERVSADTPLDPQTRIVAVVNPPEVSEDGWELGAPMSNRFMHLRDWSQPVEAFLGGLLHDDWRQVPRLDDADEDQATHERWARSVIAAFLKAHPELLHCLPENPEERQYAWPSPRSWTMLSKLLAVTHGARVGGAELPTSVTTLLADGCVGPVAGTQLLGFLDGLLLVDPAVILADPAGWDVPEQPDRAWASLMQMESYLRAHEADAGLWRAGGDTIAHVALTHADVAVAAATSWWSGGASVHGPGAISPKLASSQVLAVLKLTT